MVNIPPQAKKVFSGIIFDIYQREQQMFDGTTSTFELAKKPYTVETIPVTKSGKIIMTRQMQPNKTEPYVCFPGGRLDKGEDTLIGAKRELLEETGMSSDNIFLYKTFDMAYKIDYKFLLYIAKDVETVGAQKLDGGEKIEMFELDFDQMIEIICDENFGFPQLSSHIFRMKQKGTLGEFKSALGL